MPVGGTVFPILSGFAIGLMGFIPFWRHPCFLVVRFLILMFKKFSGLGCACSALLILVDQVESKISAAAASWQSSPAHPIVDFVRR